MRVKNTRRMLALCFVGRKTRLCRTGTNILCFLLIPPHCFLWDFLDFIHEIFKGRGYRLDTMGVLRPSLFLEPQLHDQKVNEMPLRREKTRKSFTDLVSGWISNWKWRFSWDPGITWAISLRLKKQRKGSLVLLLWMIGVVCELDNVNVGWCL